MLRQNNLGLLLLAVWLVARGLFTILSLTFTGSEIILALLAIAAGLLILLGSRKLSHNLGLLLLSIWLILTGLFVLVNLNFQGRDLVMAVLALAAGVLILIRR